MMIPRVRASLKSRTVLKNVNVKNSSSARNATTTLKSRLQSLIPEKKAEIEQVKKEHGEKVLGTCTVNQAYGGVRDVWCMVTETSLLDAEKGIEFRGYSIPQLQEKLPKAPGGQEPLPEGLLYLMLTGEIPTKEQVAEVTADLNSRSHVPSSVTKIMAQLPKEMHPMTQFNIGINLLQTQSIFSKKYNEGMKKGDYWDATYEDTMNLLAKLPEIAAFIYCHTYRDGKLGQAKGDWSQRLATMMGYESHAFQELMRLYLTIHADHEGGNVSAHTTHLVGSALSDPYQSYSAGMQGLAGPLHGLANQEVLRWTKDFQKKIGKANPTAADVEKALWDTLNAGQVIPGFGHAVLRKTDPRYTCQREFALKHLPNDPLFQLVSTIYQVAPEVLKKQGKTKNPWPNVDAHSGCLLTYYGLVEENFYTVLFGVSRGLGVLSSLVWDRALGFPIERPKSVTTEWIKNNMK